MLIPNETLWETDRILKIEGSDAWDNKDSPVITDCVLKMIKSHLEEATVAGEEAILIIDLSKGVFPPWTQVLKIAKFFVVMRSLIVSGLACTVLYASTPDQKTWSDRVLALYTPAKPVHVVSSKKGMREVISGYRQLASKGRSVAASE